MILLWRIDSVSLFLSKNHSFLRFIVCLLCVYSFQFNPQKPLIIGFRASGETWPMTGCQSRWLSLPPAGIRAVPLILGGISRTVRESWSARDFSRVDPACQVVEAWWFGQVLTRMVRGARCKSEHSCRSVLLFLMNARVSLCAGTTLF